jgi:hypothetical protein
LAIHATKSIARTSLHLRAHSPRASGVAFACLSTMVVHLAIDRRARVLRHFNPLGYVLHHRIVCRRRRTCFMSILVETSRTRVCRKRPSLGAYIARLEVIDPQLLDPHLAGAPEAIDNGSPRECHRGHLRHGRCHPPPLESLCAMMLPRVVRRTGNRRVASVATVCNCPVGSSASIGRGR